MTQLKRVHTILQHAKNGAYLENIEIRTDIANEEARASCYYTPDPLDALRFEGDLLDGMDEENHEARKRICQMTNAVPRRLEIAVTITDENGKLAPEFDAEAFSETSSNSSEG